MLNVSLNSLFLSVCLINSIFSWPSCISFPVYQYILWSISECTMSRKIELSVTKRCVKMCPWPFFISSSLWKKGGLFTAPYCCFQLCNIIESHVQRFWVKGGNGFFWRKCIEWSIKSLLWCTLMFYLCTRIYKEG